MNYVKLKDLSGNEHEFYNFHCECNRSKRTKEIHYSIWGRYSPGRDAPIYTSYDIDETLNELDQLNELLDKANNEIDNQEGESL